MIPSEIFPFCKVKGPCCQLRQQTAQGVCQQPACSASLGHRHNEEATDEMLPSLTPASCPSCPSPRLGCPSGKVKGNAPRGPLRKLFQAQERCQVEIGSLIFPFFHFSFFSFDPVVRSSPRIPPPVPLSDSPAELRSCLFSGALLSWKVNTNRCQLKLASLQTQPTEKLKKGKESGSSNLYILFNLH